MRRRRRRSGLSGIGILAVVIILIGVWLVWYREHAGGTATQGNGPTSTSVSGSIANSGIVVANGKGWSGTHLDGALPSPGACHVGHEGDQVLPDRQCTPGAIDPTVTQADLAQTICRKGGYTSTVRPPESVTEPVKRELLRSYDLTGSLSQYELDHLIPLELGGASDVRNLWPEQNIGSPNRFAVDRGRWSSRSVNGMRLTNTGTPSTSDLPDPPPTPMACASSACSLSSESSDSANRAESQSCRSRR